MFIESIANQYSQSVLLKKDAVYESYFIVYDIMRVENLNEMSTPEENNENEDKTPSPSVPMEVTPEITQPVPETKPDEPLELPETSSETPSLPEPVEKTPEEKEPVEEHTKEATEEQKKEKPNKKGRRKQSEPNTGDDKNKDNKKDNKGKHHRQNSYHKQKQATTTASNPKANSVVVKNLSSEATEEILTEQLKVFL